MSARTHHRKYVVLVSVSARTYISEYTHLTPALSQGIRIKTTKQLIGDENADKPCKGDTLHSPGRKPWVNYWNTFIEPQRGGTSET